MFQFDLLAGGIVIFRTKHPMSALLNLRIARYLPITLDGMIGERQT